MSENNQSWGDWLSANKIKVGAAVVAVGVGIALLVRSRNRKKPQAKTEDSGKTTEKSEAKAVEAKAVEAKAVEAKAVETKAVEAKAVETKAVEAKGEPNKQKEKASEKTPAVTVTVPSAIPAVGELSYDNLISMFNDMIEAMPRILFALTQRCEMKKQQGVAVDEIQTWAEKEYPKKLEETHTQLLLKYNTTEEASEAACKKYENDPKFKQLMEKLENLNRRMTGGDIDEEKLAALPSWLTSDKVVEIFSDMMDVVTDCLCTSMRTVHGRHRGEGLNQILLNAEVKAEFTGMVSERKEQVFKKHNIKESDLDLAIQKYSQNEAFAQAIWALNSKQHVALRQVQQELGMSMGMQM